MMIDIQNQTFGNPFGGDATGNPFHSSRGLRQQRRRKTSTASGKQPRTVHSALACNQRRVRRKLQPKKSQIGNMVLRAGCGAAMAVSTTLALLSCTSAFVIPAATNRAAPARPQTSSSLSMSTTETAKAQYTLDKKAIGGPLTPIANSILVKVRSKDAASDGGIILPEKAQVKPTEGVVVAMGPGKTHPETGVRVDLPCEVGDKVLYGEYDGTAVDYLGADHQFVRDQDILFVYSGERMQPDTIKMIRDQLLVKVDPEATTTKSGLVLGMKEEDTGAGSTTGEVVATGPGRSSSNGEIVPMSVSTGDFVKFRPFAGSEVSLQGVDYRVMKVDEVLAKY